MAQLKDLLVGYEQVRPQTDKKQFVLESTPLPNLYKYLDRIGGLKTKEVTNIVEPLVIKPEIIQESVKEPIQVRIKRVNNLSNYNKFMNELNTYADKYGLDEQTKKELEYLAAVESDYNQKALNTTSTAAGYFQFLDSTRKDYSNVSKEQFLNSPEEQFNAATKYLKYLKTALIKPDIWQKGRENLSDFQILYGVWWRPKSIINYIKNGKDTYVNPDGMTLERILNYAK